MVYEHAVCVCVCMVCICVHGVSVFAVIGKFLNSHFHVVVRELFRSILCVCIHVSFIYVLCAYVFVCVCTRVVPICVSLCVDM